MSNREITSSNPAVRNGVFTRVRAEAGEGVMTLGGTLAKAAVLLLLTIASAGYAWSRIAARPDQVGFLIMVGALGGFVVAMVTIFKPNLAPITSPFYAVLEGVALGAISAIYNARYRGLPMQAVALTFGVALVMLLLYTSGAVRATPRFRKIITIAGLGILAVYLTNMVMGLFGATGFGFVAAATPLGIGFSVLAASVAAFFLILDFDLIEEGVRSGAPKRMEWYGGFTLLMTLVWLYLELLRLLDKLRR
ncbi:MAG TPA: Bax inhibitor-1/YccA family protein [Gemmatimonadaceae bacterium]|nr:Bax inhibitor-1/YccA family protein [Gemmatimonadaceae bacterium]